MRGFPLISLLLVVLFLGAAAIPLAVLSRDKQPPPPAASFRADSTQETRETTVTIRLAHPVSAASIRRGEKFLYEWEIPEADPRTLETRLPLSFTEHVTEFELVLTWPQGAPESVAEVTVEPDGLDKRQQNVWGEGAANELLHFSWDERD